MPQDVLPLSFLGSTATLEHGESSLDLIFPQDPLRESSRECALFKRGHEETRKLLRSCPPAGVDITRTLTPVPKGAILGTGIGRKANERKGLLSSACRIPPACYQPNKPFSLVFFALNIYFWLPPVLIRRRQWHPTPVLLPGKSHGQRSLVGCSPWGR